MPKPFAEILKQRFIDRLGESGTQANTLTKVVLDVLKDYKLTVVHTGDK